MLPPKTLTLSGKALDTGENLGVIEKGYPMSPR
jgi:hypothetical protein